MPHEKANMGFFDFLWGGEKKRETQDASAGYVPLVIDNEDSSSDGTADSGGDAGGGGGDGGAV